MALEALWAVTFETVHNVGTGIIVFETGRIFGGDASFYYLGSFTYHPRDQSMSGEVEVVRHALHAPFIFVGYDRGRVRLSGHVSEPTMILSGHLAQDPRQTIAVHCRHLVDLP
jgi:hypothetical protein